MTRDTDDVVYDLFHRVVKLPPEEWRDALLRFANEDESLAKQVIALLELEQAYPDKSQDPDFSGRLIDGEFELLEKVGEGGMGVVYRARQVRTKQIVAVKLIRPGLTQPGVVERFESELRIMGHLHDDPAICRILRAGSDEDERGLTSPFIAMEFVAGTPLTTHSEQIGASPRLRISLFRKVCRGVQRAHAPGIVHCDLKPSNILVLPNGEPKILDFGIARASGEIKILESDRAEAHPVGTPRYMSPEQAEGGSAELDSRTDVYSLGVVLHELLTGKVPPRPAAAGETVVCEKQRSRDRRWRHGFTLTRVLSTALASEPSGRFSNAGALDDALRRWQWLDATRRHSYKAVAAVLVVACAMLCLHLATRHVAVGEDGGGRIVVRNGTRLSSSMVGHRPTLDTGLTLRDDVGLAPGARYRIETISMWRWHYSDEVWAAELAGPLRPASLAKWQWFRGDWDGAASIFKGVLGRIRESDEDLEIEQLWADVIKVGHRETVPMLLVFLRDSNPEIRKSAANALGWCKGSLDQGIVGELFRVAQSDPEESVRKEAVEGLGRLSASRELLVLVNGESKALRDAATAALTKSAIDDAGVDSSVLRELLARPETSVKTRVLDTILDSAPLSPNAFQRVKDTVLPGALTAIAADNEGLKQSAIRIVGILGKGDEAAARQALLPVLASPQPEFRLVAAMGLVNLFDSPGEEVVSALGALIADKRQHIYVRERAAKSLGQLTQSPGVGQLLRDRLADRTEARNTANDGVMAGPPTVIRGHP